MLGIDKFIGFLQESQRPLILMGQGARKYFSEIGSFSHLVTHISHIDTFGIYDMIII
jgi:thiamine pyrophosphate-dependent acetolactate synthase large subunit-like protein